MSTIATPRYPEAIFLDEEVLPAQEVGQWRLVWRRFLRHRLAVVGALVLGIITVVCLAAPWIAPYPYDKQDPALINVFPGPSREHWLGTDELGRDVLSRLMYAGRISLTVAISSTLLSVIIGVLIGAVAAYYGGVIEMILMRFTDMMLALPTLPLLLVFSKMLRDFVGLQRLFGEALSVYVIITVLTLFGWMSVARLVHGSVLSLKHREFVEAARALGASGWRIIFAHLVPNSMAPIIVAATLGIGTRVIAEASLSFLGLGIVPPTPSWGNMLSDVQAYMWTNPWLAFYPGITISVVVLSINLMGDALRDALDPRLRH